MLDIVSIGSSISLFAIAPQPLLMLLGHLLNDKYNVAVFQCHRRENDKWRWDNEYRPVDFRVSILNSENKSDPVALVFSLSSEIALDRITTILGEHASIYTVTIEEPNRNFVTHPSIMDDFIVKSREVLEDAKRRYGNDVALHVFPVMPVSLAVRFGMDYMQKTDNPLIVYDNLPGKGFIPALRIGGR